MAKTSMTVMDNAIEMLREHLAFDRPSQLGPIGQKVTVAELCEYLRHANRVMDPSGCIDGGTAGALMGLAALRRFVEPHLPHAEADELLRPIHDLIEALGQLYDGKVLPILAPRRVSHRKRIGRDARVFKACCIVAADILREHGASADGVMSREEADDFVRKHSREPAKAFGLKMNPRTLETWRNALRKERRMMSRGKLSALVADVEALRRVFAFVEWNAKAAETIAHALLTSSDLIRHKVCGGNFALIPLDQEEPAP